MSAEETAGRKIGPDVSPGRRQQRLEELKRDLEGNDATRAAYARTRLLERLWVEEGAERMAVACVLCGHPAEVSKAETLLCASRFCMRLNTVGDDLPLPPGEVELRVWAGPAVAAVLTETLDAIKAASRLESTANNEILQREVDVCRDALILAKNLRVHEAADPCVRLLRLLPPERVRGQGVLARRTTALREAAGRVLGLLSPEALGTLWDALSGSDEAARRNALPILDYIQDPRAIPYLTTLLERRAEWGSGEMMAWNVMRAFERIGDRRALPVLRRVANGGALPAAVASANADVSGDNPHLAREARRVIQSIEQGRDSQDREMLLRPAMPHDDHLLRPVTHLPDENVRPKELLRPDASKPDTKE